MARYWHALANVICRWRVVFWAAVGIAAIVAAFGIPRLEFDTQQDTLVSSSSQLYKDNVQYQSKFGGGQLEVIFEGDPRTLLEGDNLARLEKVHDEIGKDNGFFSVTSPLTLLNAAATEIPQEVQQGVTQVQALQKKAESDARAQAVAQGKSAADADAAAQAAGSAAVQKYVAAHADEAKQFQEIGDLKITNPKFASFVIFGTDGKVRPDVQGLVPDASHALLVATITGNMSVNEQNDAASRLQGYINDAHFSGVTTTVAGEQLLLKDLSDSLRDSMPLLGAISVALMIVVVLTVFRARWRLLHLPIVALALVTAFGFMGWAGLPLTMASAAGLPILVALSVDFGIQFHNRYEEALERQRNAGAAMRHSLAAIGPALLTALVAACLGFAALRYSAVPMIRDFSLVLSLGIAVVFVVCLFVLNGILFHRDRKLTPATIPARKDSFIERGLGRVNHAIVGRALPILTLGVIVAVFGFAVDHRIRTETEPEQFIPADSQTLKDISKLSKLTSTSNSIDFLVNAPDVADPAVVKWMSGLGKSVSQSDSRITGVNSFATLLSSGGSEPDFSQQSIDDAIKGAPPAIVNGFITPDHKSADINVTIAHDVPLIDQSSIIDSITQSAHPPSGVTMEAAGLGVIGVAAEKQLTSHRLEMTFIALAAVLLLLLAVTRNIAYTLIVTLPIALVIGWTSAAMYVLQVPLNPLTAIAGPLVVALGTEFGILLMMRYKGERENGLTPQDAMATAYRLSGRAIAASAFTVVGAFLALAFHPFPLLSQFGIVAVLGVALSFAGAMLVMPPLLVWADETFSHSAEAVHDTPL